MKGTLLLYKYLCIKDDKCFLKNYFTRKDLFMQKLVEENQVIFLHDNP